MSAIRNAPATTILFTDLIIRASCLFSPSPAPVVLTPALAATFQRACLLGELFMMHDSSSVPIFSAQSASGGASHHEEGPFAVQNFSKHPSVLLHLVGVV